ncbi:ParB N-terminal domain-containing protein [Acidithiobacillus ferrivorans]|nr:ParB N-terminal domain-containing protein [Acidithiobacillus ferrivorans]
MSATQEEKDRIATDMQNRCLHLVEEQYPGLMGDMERPRLEMVSTHWKDADQFLDRAYEEKRFDLDGTPKDDCEQFADLVDFVRTTFSTIPLPKGVCIFVIGDARQKRLAIPVRMDSRFNTPSLLSIEYREVTTIHPDPYKPRREFDADAINELAENIQAVGLVRPITIKPDGTIKDGERRWMAFRDVLSRADKTKFGQIPVIVCADMISGAGGGE